MKPARLRPADLLRLGISGLRSRPTRVFLSALGIAIGVAAMLAVIGISTSTRADLQQTLDRLGTNLLTVTKGENALGYSVDLPAEAPTMISRIAPVELVSASAVLPVSVYRNDHISEGVTGSISVMAADQGLLHTVGGSVGRGSWLTAATAAYPGVVLGTTAAQRLDVRTIGVRVWLGKQWYSVVGILDPVILIPELDSAAIVGWTSATSYLHFNGHPTMIYVRAVESQITAVRGVLARTANPAEPDKVRVSRPSDALAAKQATDAALRGMLLGLGAVALLVGGVGIANTMVMSVLERRNEIGLRRALGATRGQIRGQFLSEAIVLSALGGFGGILLGGLVTSGYATSRDLPTAIPWAAPAIAVGVTLVIGVIAGLYPAVRASRLPPTEALTTA